MNANYCRDVFFSAARLIDAGSSLIRIGASVLAGGLVLGSSLHAQTVSLAYEITIQPIYVQNGPAGSIAVKTNYESLFLPSNSIFKQATQQIFAQAGVRINWLAPATYESATYYSGVDALNLSTFVDPASFAVNKASTNPNVLNLWFVGSINSGGALGLSTQTVWSGGTASFTNGVTVAETVFSGNNYDTIAHEIGHNLGLTHVTLADTNRVMFPNATHVTLGNIFPFGTQWDLLSAGEISLIQSIPPLDGGIFNPALVHTITPVNYTYTLISVPEPADYAGIFGLVAGFCVLRRKRNAV